MCIGRWNYFKCDTTSDEETVPLSIVVFNTLHGAFVLLSRQAVK